MQGGPQSWSGRRDDDKQPDLPYQPKCQLLREFKMVLYFIQKNHDFELNCCFLNIRTSSGAQRLRSFVCQWGKDNENPFTWINQASVQG